MVFTVRLRWISEDDVHVVVPEGGNVANDPRIRATCASFVAKKKRKEKEAFVPLVSVRRVQAEDFDKALKAIDDGLKAMPKSESLLTLKVR